MRDKNKAQIDDTWLPIDKAVLELERTLGDGWRKRTILSEIKNSIDGHVADGGFAWIQGRHYLKRGRCVTALNLSAIKREIACV